MRNQYEGWCQTCGVLVTPFQGHVFKGIRDAKWKVYCFACWRLDDGREARYRPELAAARGHGGCWAVLGVAPSATRLDIDRAYREKAKAAHPDAPGGSHEMMVALNTARDEARRMARQ